MADSNNTIKTTVELDANQAQQEIVKLNSKASDSTKTLEERIEAKNKAVQLQNDLSKKTIKALEDEYNRLIKTNGSIKEIEKVSKKLNAERLKSVKVTASNEKQQAKLTEALKNSKSAFKSLDDASGGLLTKFKALATNPIGLTIAALVGVFKLFQRAVKRSGKATETFGKIGAKLSGLFNGLLAVLEPTVEFIGDKLLSALNDPKQAIIDLGDSIKENLINRVKSFLVIGESLAELLKGNFKKAAKLATDGVIQFATGTTNATDKAVEFGEKAKIAFDKAAKATNDLANSERTLVRNRIALEKQQLTSLKLAEEQRQIRDDTSKSIAERMAANTELGKLLDEQANKEMAIAQQSLNLALAKQAADGQTIESIEAIGDAEIKLLEIQERITGQRSEQLVNETGLLKEREDLKKQAVLDAEKRKEKEEEQKKADKEKAEEERLVEQEVQNELEELEIEKLKAKDEATLERELEFLEKKRLQDVSAKDLTASQIDLIDKKAEAEKEKLRNASEEAEKRKEDAVLDNALNGAAEAFGIAQEVAVAKMIMAAPEAIAGSFKNAAATYAPPLSFAMGALGAATTVVPIIKGLSDIKKARFPGGKGKSRGGGGGSISAPSSGGGGGGIPPGITSDIVSDLSSNNAARLGVDTNLGSSAGSDASNNVLASSSKNVVFSESAYSDFQNQVKFKEDKTTI